jgi:hypothetical protein
MRVLVALFLVGHGLVHAIYVGQARRLFQVQPGASWPDASWALSRVWGDPATRWLVAILFAVVAAAFAVAGAALLLRAPWWAPVATSAAVASAATLLLAWDGRLRDVAVQGAYALALDAAIVALAVLFRWPSVDG